MSDTPETDELWHKRPEQFEVYKLARKLERERDEARKEIEEVRQDYRLEFRLHQDSLEKWNNCEKESRELREEMESEKRWAAQYKQERDKWADTAAQYSLEREHNACYAKQMEAERDNLRLMLTASQNEVDAYLGVCTERDELHAELERLKAENEALCQFINREMKMTADDPRIAELSKAMKGSE